MGNDKADVVADERGVGLEEGPDTAESGGASEDKRSSGLGRAWPPILFLLVIPAMLSLSVPVVPFLPLSTGAKVWLVSALLVGAEVVFWGAALFFGKEVVSRYRRFFDPRNWFRGR